MPIPSLTNSSALRKIELAARIGLSDSKDTRPPEERGPVVKKKVFKHPGVPGTRVGVSNENKKEINKLTNLHHEIQDQKEKVNALKNNALNTFKGTKYAKQVEHMLNLFSEREKELLQQELATHKKMHDIAEDHLPEDIRKMFNKVMNPVVRGLSGMYKGAVKRYTISYIPGMLLQFQEIIDLKNLRNDAGFVYKNFWLICTCVVDERSHYHYYADTSVKPPVPNVTAIGTQTRGFSFTKSQDGIRQLATHLQVDDQLDIALPTELPKSKKEIEGNQFRNPKIRKVSVDEEQRTITFITTPVTEQQEQKIVSDILADLQGLFHSDHMHEKLKYRIAHLVDRGSKITVWVGTPQPRISSEYKANSHKLDVLQHELQLSKEEADQIRRLLRGRQADPSEVEGNE